MRSTISCAIRFAAACSRKFAYCLLSSSTFVCSSADQQPYCEPTLIPALGVTFVELSASAGCRSPIASGRDEYRARVPTATPADPFVGAVEPMPSASRLPSPTATVAAASKTGGGAQQPATRRATTLIAGSPYCPDGIAARIQVVDGIELANAAEALVVQLDAPDACLHVCQMNAHLDGRAFTRACRTAAFDRSTGRCSIFEDTISPNGDLNYM